MTCRGNAPRAAPGAGRAPAGAHAHSAWRRWASTTTRALPRAHTPRGFSAGSARSPWRAPCGHARSGRPGGDRPPLRSHGPAHRRSSRHRAAAAPRHDARAARPPRTPAHDRPAARNPAPRRRPPLPGLRLPLDRHRPRHRRLARRARGTRAAAQAGVGGGARLALSPRAPERGSSPPLMHAAPTGSGGRPPRGSAGTAEGRGGGASAGGAPPS